MKIIAHRGFSGIYPENTMLAFKKAIEIGADGIELDVHLSKDGQVMIIHDEALKRTTGLDGVISDYTRAELEKISAGKTKNDEFGFTPIPSLEEYLAFMAEHRDKITNIELKTAPVYYPEIEEKTLELVRKFDLEKNIIYSSFNWLSIERMQRLGTISETGLLFSGMKLYNQAHIIKSLGINYFHPDFNDLTDEIVKSYLDNKVGLNVWTVNEIEDMKVCLSWNIDGLITNFPDRAISIAR
ncbi:glycerophosphodiester phosphodiesterase [Bullifex porci]|uniref:glycerophosphodiester phosphodiesterase n=1 Tax=Bullifex porci TaxID=2606638 RepID=UPI0023F0D1A4|nr:glycerophosphodiester phosphodiesterase [Bullifex porci]MDD7255592.1 glycerophosphodiester phosphodiesterase [Bullifex porci]MDY2740334.1 glycerophosphodiester phosphodiesterase [Bullifex porci]